MIVYKIRGDGVFDGQVELPDGPTIPPGHTWAAPPPIPPGSHAVMKGAWKIVAGEAPPYTPPPPPPPEAVTPLQMRRALLQQGLLDDVAAFVEASPLETRLAWEYAVEIRRDDAMLNEAASALGKTSAEVDDLFRLAATF